MGLHLVERTSKVIMLSKILALAVFMASTQALTIKITPKANVEISECLAGTSDWFGDYRLDVTPWPIEVAAGKDVTLDGEITIKQMIEVGSKLAIKLTGEVPVIGKIPIPCLEINPGLHIGSCTYDIGADLLPLLESTGQCSDFLPEGQACSLPLNPGQYAAGPAITVTLPEIPDILIPILSPLKAIGVEVTGMKADGTAVACLATVADITVG